MSRNQLEPAELPEFRLDECEVTDGLGQVTTIPCVAGYGDGTLQPVFGVRQPVFFPCKEAQCVEGLEVLIGE